MSSQRVFLCLDNIPDRLKSVKEAQAILTAGFGEGSLVVLTARSGEILERVIPEEKKRSFERVPNLTEEEAIDVLLNFPKVEAHRLAIEQKQIAAEYADLCRFGQGLSGRHGSYHPLALTILGAFLWEKYACHPSEWPPTSHFHQYASRYDAQKMIFFIFEKTFNVLHPKSLRMLLLLIFYVPNFDFVQNFHHSTFQWLVDACSVSNKFVHDAIYGMKNRGLIQRRGRNSIAFHDLLVEFGKGKLEEMEKWLSLEGMDKFPNATPSIVELLKLDHYTPKCTIPFNEFSNVSVVHLERVRNQKILNFESMIAVRSITIVDCVDLKEIRGLGSLANLRFLKVEGCTSLVRCPQIRGLKKLRHIQMQLPPNLLIVDGLSSLSKANLSLEEIYLDGNCREVLFRCFCRIRAVSINNSDGIGPLDFKDCRELQWIKLWNCKAANGLNLTGCINVRSIYVHKNDRITEIVGLDGLIALEELHLIEMNKVEHLPSFQQLVNLRYLTLRDMANLKELPDLSNCHLLTTDRIDTNIAENEVTSRNVSELIKK